MAVNALDVRNYSPRSPDVFFFDNNIWMYLFCPLSNFNKTRQTAYSSFLQSIQTAKSTIFINSLVLSEFANRYFRIDFEQWKKNSCNYSAEYKKDYIGTAKYKETAEEIVIQIKNIVKICSKAPDDFNAIDLDKVLDHLKIIDFNDSYFFELACSKKWIIVTDDQDFLKINDSDLDVLTYLD